MTFDVAADGREVVVTLNSKTLVAALVEMAGSGGVIVCMVACRMSHRDPVHPGDIAFGGTRHGSNPRLRNEGETNSTKPYQRESYPFNQKGS
ncbi:hypothetical protein Pla52n_18330 [Stieleria varia]|uniref:Uncharacterized protein n=1 Tax=Stieleria varia TaxID=2528005 RepID=A0A5C6B1V4_9BACT|nr:hypothetical protein Pla52n_18330 [Stieleria varia]